MAADPCQIACCLHAAGLQLHVTAGRRGTSAQEQAYWLQVQSPSGYAGTVTVQHASEAVSPVSFTVSNSSLVVKVTATSASR